MIKIKSEDFEKLRQRDKLDFIHIPFKEYIKTDRNLITNWNGIAISHKNDYTEYKKGDSKDNIGDSKDKKGDSEGDAENKKDDYNEFNIKDGDVIIKHGEKDVSKYWKKKLIKTLEKEKKDITVRRNDVDVINMVNVYKKRQFLLDHYYSKHGINPDERTVFLLKKMDNIHKRILTGKIEEKHENITDWHFYKYIANIIPNQKFKFKREFHNELVNTKAFYSFQEFAMAGGKYYLQFKKVNQGVFTYTKNDTEKIEFTGTVIVLKKAASTYQQQSIKPFKHMLGGKQSGSGYEKQSGGDPLLPILAWGAAPVVAATRYYTGTRIVADDKLVGYTLLEIIKNNELYYIPIDKWLVPNSYNNVPYDDGLIINKTRKSIDFDQAYNKLKKSLFKKKVVEKIKYELTKKEGILRIIKENKNGVLMNKIRETYEPKVKELFNIDNMGKVIRNYFTLLNLDFVEDNFSRFVLIKNKFFTGNKEGWASGHPDHDGCTLFISSKGQQIADRSGEKDVTAKSKLASSLGLTSNRGFNNFMKSTNRKEDGKLITLDDNTYKIKNNGDEIIITLKPPLSRVFQDRIVLKNGEDGIKNLKTNQSIAFDLRKKKLDMLTNRYCFLEFYKTQNTAFGINEIIPFPAFAEMLPIRKLTKDLNNQGIIMKNDYYKTLLMNIKYNEDKVYIKEDFIENVDIRKCMPIFFSTCLFHDESKREKYVISDKIKFNNYYANDKLDNHEYGSILGYLTLGNESDDKIILKTEEENEDLDEEQKNSGFFIIWDTKQKQQHGVIKLNYMKKHSKIGAKTTYKRKQEFGYWTKILFKFGKIAIKKAALLLLAGPVFEIIFDMIELGAMGSAALYGIADSGISDVTDITQDAIARAKTGIANMPDDVDLVDDKNDGIADAFQEKGENKTGLVSDYETLIGQDATGDGVIGNIDRDEDGRAIKFTMNDGDYKIDYSETNEKTIQFDPLDGDSFKYIPNEDNTFTLVDDSTEEVRSYDMDTGKIKSMETDDAIYSYKYSPDSNELTDITKTTQEGNIITYNPTDGTVVSTEVPLNDNTITYDGEGKVTKVVSGQGDDANIYNGTYDYTRDTTTFTSSDDPTLDVTYNADGEVTQVVRGEGDDKTITYDGEGKVTKVVSGQGGDTITYNGTYDYTGDTTTFTSSDDTPLSVTYDANGEVTQVVRGKGDDAITYDYTGDTPTSTTSGGEPEELASDSEYYSASEYTPPFVAKNATPLDSTPPYVPENVAPTDSTAIGDEIYEAPDHSKELPTKGASSIVNKTSPITEYKDTGMGTFLSYEKGKNAKGLNKLKTVPIGLVRSLDKSLGNLLIMGYSSSFTKLLQKGYFYPMVVISLDVGSKLKKDYYQYLKDKGYQNDPDSNKKKIKRGVDLEPLVGGGAKTFKLKSKNLNHSVKKRKGGGNRNVRKKIKFKKHTTSKLKSRNSNRTVKKGIRKHKFVKHKKIKFKKHKTMKLKSKNSNRTYKRR